MWQADYCPFCRGLKNEPRWLPCPTCTGVGEVLSRFSNDPWFDCHPATSDNRRFFYPSFYVHVCPKCGGRRQLQCDHPFHFQR